VWGVCLQIPLKGVGRSAHLDDNVGGEGKRRSRHPHQTRAYAADATSVAGTRFSDHEGAVFGPPPQLFPRTPEGRCVNRQTRRHD
jgi:hypothetical protein